MLEGRSQADLYAAMNVMNEKSMIRVESDEITYPLHIILRSAPYVQVSALLLYTESGGKSGHAHG